jgi:hypothetical protein
MRAFASTAERARVKRNADLPLDQNHLVCKMRGLASRRGGKRKKLILIST